MYNYHYIADLSYLIFLSAFSAFNTYEKQFGLAESEKRPELDVTADEEYNNIFMETIKHYLTAPAQQIFPFLDKSKFILCADCARKNIWRRDIYPDYKMNRDTKDKSKDKFDINKVFQYANNITIPSIIAEFNCMRISCGCAEGDDVIAVLAKKLIEEDKNNKVVIISSDRDMIQLCQDRLTLITAQGKIRDPKADMAEMLKIDKDDMPEISAKDFLLFKIILGDSSDNIPNIKYGIGPKKAFKIMQDKNLLKAVLSEDQTIYDSFIRNKQLISMNEIPKDIINMITEEYEEEKAKLNVI